MERLLRIYRATSSPVAIALLIGVNLVPLVGALFWGWNVYTLLILYWLENGIVGVFNVLKMAIAQGPVDTRSGKAAAASPAGRAFLIPFFVMHYGLFWVVHGAFVLSLSLFMGLPKGGGLSGAADVGPRWDLVFWGALGLTISHGASFLLNYIGRGEYRTASLPLLMFSPYGRLVALHLTILIGGILSLTLGSPVGAVVVLVAIKTAIDLALHLREHRTAAVGVA